MEEIKSNIYDINDGKKEDKKEDKEADPDFFAETVRRNAENAERLRKERAKANQGVIRSYRLKR